MIETVTPVMSVLRSPSQTSGSAATASYHSIEKPPSGSDGKRSSLKEKTKLAAIGAKMKAKASRRSEEHTSELQSLMRISYAVLCLKKKKIKQSETRQEHRN